MLLIAALGVAFYVGIRASGPDMELSADAFYDQTNLMDIRVLGTLGMTESDVAALRQIEGISDAEGAYSADVFCTVDGSEYIATLFSLCSSINRLTVEQGRLPEKADECFADPLFMQNCGLHLGDTITLHSGTDDPLSDTLALDTFTIVGSGSYSWYLSWERGTTGLGDGNVDFFLGLHPDAFSMEAYTAVYAAVDSLDCLNSYSSEYSTAISEIIERIESIADQRCEIRYRSITGDAQDELNEAQQKIDDAQQEIDDGLLELEEALLQLTDAEQEIIRAESELSTGQQELEDARQKIADGEQELVDGREAIEEARLELNQQTAILNQKKADLRAGQAELDAQIAALEQKQTEVSVQKAALQQNLASLESQQSELLAQRNALEAQQTELLAQKTPLVAQQTELSESISFLRSQKSELLAQKDSISQALSLFEQRNQLQAQLPLLNDQLAQVESRLTSLKAARAPYDEQIAELNQQQAAIDELKAPLDARQTELNERQSKLDAEEASIKAAHAALASLSPASWMTVDGYQAMLSHMNALSGGTLSVRLEQNVLQSVSEAVESSLSDDHLTDELLAAVVPDAASSALRLAYAELSIYEEALQQNQSELLNEQIALNESFSSLNLQQQSLDAVRAPLIDAIASFDATQHELTAAQTSLISGIAETEHGLFQLETAISSLSQSYDELLAAQSAIDAGLSQIDGNLSALESAFSQVESGLSQINSGLDQIEAGLSEISVYQQQIDSGRAQMNDALSQIDEGLLQIEAAWTQIHAAQATLDDGRVQLANGESQLRSVRLLLDSKEKELQEGEAELLNARLELADAESELEKGRKELDDGKSKLADARAEYEQGLLDYEEAVAKAQPELEDARRQLSDAQEELNKVEKPEWYVLDRNSIQTFVEYGMDADRISAIGRVFPVIFFLVAALVCLTGMTRMVEEERIQIGTFKALGYDKYAIAAKYFLYAFLASVMGSIIGILLGSSLLPAIIMDAYGILYATLTTHLTPINWPLSLSAVGLAVFCTVFAAMAACLRTLRETPANLMRPTAPPNGKRVFLEFIHPLWRRLSFAQKAAARNLFRYKKRLFMTIFGIAGCMALLVVGFGLRDSIQKIVSTQYSTVWTYDASLTTDAENLEFTRSQLLNSEPSILDALAVHQTALDAEANGRTVESYLFVPESAAQLESFVQLRSRTTPERYQLDDHGVIITEKLATLLGLRSGDTLSLCRSETERYDVRIQAVSENYLYHYIYMTPAFYAATFGETAEYAQLFFHTKSMSAEESLSFSERLLSMESVKSVSLVSDLQENVAEMMDAMNLVIWVLIIAAGLLAFIVLFNLNNISILERRRELATLRVLGFYDGELAAYLYRENVVLTLLGVAAGVGLGILLHRFIIGTCEIDMIMFGRVIQPVSYLMSVLMTIFFAALVNLGMFFTLRKIDMVESLKSVE